jgi:hypothetical protein
MRFVGIDVAAERHVVAVVDESWSCPGSVETPSVRHSAATGWMA